MAKATKKPTKKTAPKKKTNDAARKITKETRISDILEIDENLAEVFFEFGMHCLGCSVAHLENIEQACQTHGIDADELVAALNEKAAEK